MCNSDDYNQGWNDGWYGNLPPEDYSDEYDAGYSNAVNGNYDAEADEWNSGNDDDDDDE